MAAWKLTIGGVDYSAYVHFETVHIARSIQHRGSTCSFDVEIDNRAIARPKGFQEVILTRVSDSKVLFGGVLALVWQVGDTPRTYVYQCTCADYTRWLDHVPAGGTAYTNTFDGLVKSLMDDWVTKIGAIDAYGMLQGPAVPIDSVGNYPNVYPVSVNFTTQPNYLPVSGVIDQLAKQVNAQWFISDDKHLYFFLPDSNPFSAPLASTSVTFYNQDLNGTVPKGYTTQSLPTLDADNPFANLLGGELAATSYFNLKIGEDVTSAISAVTARNYSAVSTKQLTESGNTNNTKLVGDGKTKFFRLYNPPVDPAHTTVTVAGGTTYTNGAGNLLVEYAQGQATDNSAVDLCYVCPSNGGIRFNVAPANAANITVTYNYYYPAQDVSQRNDALAREIAAREAFGPGYYWQVLSDASLTAPISELDGTPTWLAAEQLMLNRYARIKLPATFNSYVWGWKPGQVFAIVSPLRGDGSIAASGYDPWNATQALGPYAGQTIFAQRFWVTQTQTLLLNDTRTHTQVEASSDIWGA